MIGEDTVTEDLLRDARDDGAKALKTLNRIAATIGPPVIQNIVPPAPIGPAPVTKVTVTHAKGWRFRITERDLEGRIVEFTATPAS